MSQQQDNVIIIGAGASGIIMACQLQRKYNFTNFEIYERGSDFGGTWYFNTYPGCSCDVPSYFYSFSFAKRSDWTRICPPQPEIKAYMIDVAKEYNLYPHTHFQTECLGAEWNKEAERWNINFKDLEDGKIFSKSCKFLILAAGVLSVANPCPVPGIEDFRGKAWHSANWNHNVSLENKDVIVIGNGCSAAQFVPAILPKTKTLSQFIRSPHWILELPVNSNAKFPNWFKWIMKNIPGANTLHRALWCGFLELFYPMFWTKSGKWIRDLMAKMAEKYIRSQAPAKYHDILIPKFPVGAKRRIFDSGYLQCLNDPKVFLTDDPLVQIKEKSVLTKSGKEYPADIIVYATGFQVHDYSTPMDIKGKNGESLRAKWERQGGMRAYMGIMTADFPNMFMIIGPNTASGHTSIIYMAESNVRLILKLMRPLLQTNSKGSIEVKEEAERKDVEWVQKRMKDHIWGTAGEGGWYIDKRTGHNGTLYPHFQTQYRLRTLRTNWSNFNISGVQRKNKLSELNVILLIVVCLIVLFSWLLILKLM